MDIFKRKPKTELPPLLSDADLIDYNSVVDYLTGLSDTDYKRICKVAVIYREANTRAAAILEQPNDPTTFILPQEPVDAMDILLDDDDELVAAFEGSEADTIATAPQTKMPKS